MARPAHICPVMTDDTFDQDAFLAGLNNGPRWPLDNPAYQSGSTAAQRAFRRGCELDAEYHRFHSRKVPGLAEQVEQLEYRVRVEKPLADVTRQRNEDLLRGSQCGPRKPKNWRPAATEFRQLVKAGMSFRDAVRILDPKYFGRPSIYDPKRASKRAETYQRWESEL